MNIPASQPKILVVDDEPINVDVLGGVLSSLGEIVTANNGRAAIEICKSNKPDIVLLDVMMPQMDGYEVFAKLKGDEETNDIPIIFVTALADDTDEARKCDGRNCTRQEPPRIKEVPRLLSRNGIYRWANWNSKQTKIRRTLNIRMATCPSG